MYYAKKGKSCIEAEAFKVEIADLKEDIKFGEIEAEEIKVGRKQLKVNFEIIEENTGQPGEPGEGASYKR